MRFVELELKLSADCGQEDTQRIRRAPLAGMRLFAAEGAYGEAAYVVICAPLQQGPVVPARKQRQEAFVEPDHGRLGRVVDMLDEMEEG